MISLDLMKSSEVRKAGDQSNRDIKNEAKNNMFWRNISYSGVVCDISFQTNKKWFWPASLREIVCFSINCNFWVFHLIVTHDKISTAGLSCLENLTWRDLIFSDVKGALLHQFCSWKNGIFQNCWFCTRQKQSSVQK